MNVLNILCIVLMTALIIRHNTIKISIPLIWLLAQYLTLFISTFFNRGNMFAVIINSGLIIALCLSLDIIYNNSRKLYIFLCLVRNITLLFFIINCVVAIIMPDGIPRLSSGTTPYFLYGNINNTIKYVFPGLCCSMIIDHLNDKNISIYTFLFLAGLMYNFVFIYFMATAFIGLVVVIIWNVFYNIFKNHSAIIFTVVLFLILFVELFVIIQSGGLWISGLITYIFGKDISFSGRRVLWIRVISAIIQKPILGYGLCSSEYIRSMIGNTSGSHNYYLDIVFQRGIIGLIIFFGIVIIIIPRLVKTLNKTQYILLGFVCAYLVMFLSEPFSSTEKFHIPVFYMLLKLLEDENNNKQTGG
ncbi:O-antigen ligase family protein [Lachnospiraceae bacterium 62-26]